MHDLDLNISNFIQSSEHANIYNSDTSDDLRKLINQSMFHGFEWEGHHVEAEKKDQSQESLKVALLGRYSHPGVP